MKVWNFSYPAKTLSFIQNFILQKGKMKNSGLAFWYRRQKSKNTTHLSGIYWLFKGFETFQVSVFYFLLLLLNWNIFKSIYVHIFSRSLQLIIKAKTKCLFRLTSAPQILSDCPLTVTSQIRKNSQMYIGNSRSKLEKQINRQTQHRVKEMDNMKKNIDMNNLLSN